MTKIKLSPCFLVEDMQDHNIFGCKIYSEAICLGLNLTFHTHIPVYNYSKYPPWPQLMFKFISKLLLFVCLEKKADQSCTYNLLIGLLTSYKEIQCFISKYDPSL